MLSKSPGPRASNCFSSILSALAVKPVASRFKQPIELFGFRRAATVLISGESSFRMLVGCSARAASGQAAAPPSSVMNSRRGQILTAIPNSVRWPTTFGERFTDDGVALRCRVLPREQLRTVLSFFLLHWAPLTRGHPQNQLKPKLSNLVNLNFLDSDLINGAANI